MSAILPTVGRKVWFRPNGHLQLGMTELYSGTPMDATVVYVWGPNMVNLLVVDHVGNQFPVNSVTLAGPDTPIPSWSYCEWMPYQLGQAKKEGGAP